MSLLLLFAGTGMAGAIVFGTVTVSDDDLTPLSVSDEPQSSVEVSDSELMPERFVFVYDSEL